jgi:hypothetical protein
MVDDAKAPERPFSVRCPKCQAIVKFPGRPPAAAPATPAPVAATPAASPTTDFGPEVLDRLQRQIRGAQVGPGRGQVLVALADRALTEALTAPLRRLGYGIDTLDRPEEGGRLLEEGFYEVVVTSKTAAVPGKGESLYQRVVRLPPDARRNVFLVLAGDEFKTGDGAQAFVAQADLVVGAEAGDVEHVLLNTMAERTRLFQVLREARRRFEEAAG